MKKFQYIALFFMMFMGSAQAHHFKGMPHFNYFDNYPQVPTEEYIGQAGRYEFAFMVYDFQGLTQSEMEMPDDVRVYMIIYDLIENVAYKGPLLVEILDGDKVVKRFAYKSSAEESIYQLRHKLNEKGDFSLRISINQNGEKIIGVKPFLLSNQRINWAIWISLIMFVLLSIVAYGSRQARLKMDRRENALAHNNSAQEKNS
jgi:hypothetical protein